MTDPIPSGTRAIVDQAVEEAAQTLFSAADVPLARTDELLAAIQGPSLRAVLEFRVEQIVKHGYTAENDAMLPLLWLPRQATDYASWTFSRREARELGHPRWAHLPDLEPAS
jgi:hypothetical protein